MRQVPRNWPGARLVVSAVALAAVALAGCSLLPGQPVPPATGVPVSDDLATHQRAWASGGVTSYTWQVTFGCECLLSGPTTVTVVDGAPVEVMGGMGVVRPEDIEGFPLTIDALYAEARRTLEGGGTVAVTWDPASGLPVTMQLDRDLQAVDDELFVTVDSVTPAS